MEEFWNNTENIGGVAYSNYGDGDIDIYGVVDVGTNGVDGEVDVDVNGVVDVDLRGSYESPPVISN